MGLFDLFRRENRADSIKFEDALLQALLGNGEVSKEIALQIPAINGGIDLITNIIAGTPIKLYKDNDGKAEEVRDDSRVKLLNDETGDTLNANEFWHAMIRDYYLGKGGYAYINRRAGKIASLHYVDESQLSVIKNNDPIFKDYDIQVGGTTYRPWDFMKILRNTKDGASGVPIIRENSEIIAAAYQGLKLEHNMASRGGNKKGFLKATKRIDQASIDTLKTAFSNLYKSDSNNTVVLNDGLEFQECSDTAAEMQLNENKKANADEFAKIFHISADVIEGKATDIGGLAKLAAIPLMNAIQCSMNRDLLKEKEKGVYYFAFDTKELLKGEMKERFEAYKTALDANFMQIDEVRYAEDLEPLGLTWIKIGLQDVLYDPKSGTVYTPNTNQTNTIGSHSDGLLQPRADDDIIEERGRIPIRGDKGRFAGSVSDGKNSSGSGKAGGKNYSASKKEITNRLIGTKTSNGVTVKSVSDHAINRIQTREVSIENVKAALKEGKPQPGNVPGRKVFEYRGTVAILQVNNGELVTVKYQGRKEKNGKIGVGKTHR